MMGTMTATGTVSSQGTRIPDAILKAHWQTVIYADRPKRLDLQSLKPEWPCRTVRVAVHRNTPFEFIAQAIVPFLAFGSLQADFSFGDYDDSLLFPLIPADVQIVWLDYDRYAGHLDGIRLADWIGERLTVLRAGTTAPILVANWPADHAQAQAFNDRLAMLVAGMAGTRLHDRRSLYLRMGASYLDNRFTGIGATNLSGPATLLTAREIGLRCLPAALRPRLKCIAVDFDNTLYAGVLGEDGVAGVQLTEAHAALQRRLLTLYAEGVFLAAISKNEAADVEQLLAERTDFPLRREHFSAMAVSWEPKAQGMARIAEALRIGTDAILFVDDNLGEIADVTAAFPTIATLHSADPVITLAGLELGPDLTAWSRNETDALRATDLAMASQREASMAGSADPAEYLRSLDTRIDFHLNPRDQTSRVHELSNKTNQFNLALKRLGEVEVAGWFDQPGHSTVTFRLSDRLSDSGIVGIMLMAVADGVLKVEELCISCRALGRRLEDLMIASAIDKVANAAGCHQVSFAHAKGPRNMPARDWLAGFLGAPLLSDAGYCTISWPPEGLFSRLAGIPVTSAWH
jgi:FkbH-like protein